MIKTELGGITVYAPDFSVADVREAIERECDDDELASTSSANLGYVLWRQARRREQK